MKHDMRRNHMTDVCQNAYPSPMQINAVLIGRDSLNLIVTLVVPCATLSPVCQVTLVS